MTLAIGRLTFDPGTATRRLHSFGIRPTGPSIATSANSRSPGTSVVQIRRFSFAVGYLGCFLLVSPATGAAMPSIMPAAATPAADAKSRPIKLAQAQPAQPSAPASPAQAAGDEPVGNVATATGSASVTRNKTATR